MIRVGIMTLVVVCSIGVSTPNAWSQPRSEDDKVSELQHLEAIRQAALSRTNVDADESREAAFPGRSLHYFDRDRDGEFYTNDAAWGLYDYQRAVVQFIHDTSDFDGDGVPGFYELECEAAGGPALDPLDPQTTPGIPDSVVDCDGDGLGNLAELLEGMDPLNANDGNIDSDNDGVSDAVELANGTRHTPVLYLADGLGADGQVTIAFMLDRQPGEVEPVLGQFYLEYDNTQLTYDTTELGAAAIEAGRKSVFASAINPTTIRANITSSNLVSMGSGSLLLLHFDPVGDGPYMFTVDTENTTLSPAAARVGLTFGAGHPNEPLVLQGGM